MRSNVLLSHPRLLDRGLLDGGPRVFVVLIVLGRCIDEAIDTLAPKYPVEVHSADPSSLSLGDYCIGLL